MCEGQVFEVIGGNFQGSCELFPGCCLNLLGGAVCTCQAEVMVILTLAFAWHAVPARGAQGYQSVAVVASIVDDFDATKAAIDDEVSWSCCCVFTWNECELVVISSSIITSYDKFGTRHQDWFDCVGSPWYGVVVLFLQKSGEVVSAWIVYPSEPKIKEPQQVIGKGGHDAAQEDIVAGIVVKRNLYLKAVCGDRTDSQGAIDFNLAP